MKYFFETYGCQMNEAESFSMEQLLLKMGWQEADRAEHANLIIINTCSVRITAENRVLGRLGYYSALKKQRYFFVLLIGCMAERLYDDIQKKYPLIDYVVGMFERHLLPKIFLEIETLLKERIEEKDFREEIKFLRQNDCVKKGDNNYYFAPFSYHEGAMQSFVPIMNGCNNFCSYCIVPYVRGRECSRPVEDILKEIDMLSAKDVKEITLLGQNVNSYKEVLQNGSVVDFPSLLHLIDQRVAKKNSIKWIRFISSHPKDMSTSLIDIISSVPRICKAVHLPIQHGSNKILKRMNRGYTVEDYLKKIEYLRQKVPNVALTADILMGFPGEDEEDVALTLHIMREIEFDNAFMYYYNPREGTKAYYFEDQIDEKIKIERLQRVIELQLEITHKKMTQKVGKKVTVLLESTSKNDVSELFGHTEANEMAVVEGALPTTLIGEFISVRIKELKGKTFRCTKE